MKWAKGSRTVRLPLVVSTKEKSRTCRPRSKMSCEMVLWIRGCFPIISPYRPIHQPEEVPR